MYCCDARTARTAASTSSLIDAYCRSRSTKLIVSMMCVARRDGPHRSHWRQRAELVARVSRGCVRGRILMPRRRLLLALVIAGAILVVGGGTGAALCKFKYQCGIGSLFSPSSSGYA